VDFQENVFLKVRKILEAGAKKVCFDDFKKDMFLKSTMKNVVKYCVY